MKALFLRSAALPLAALLVAVLHLTGCGDRAAGPLIVIDGDFSDWDAVPPAIVDSLENGPGAVDFGEVRVESDDSALYFAIDLGRTVNPQAMQGTIRLVLDSDGDPATGRTMSGLDGADRVIVFSPKPSVDALVGQGIVTVTGDDGEPADVYGLGFEFAPTWADRYTEVRIRRGVDGALEGGRFRARLVYEDATGRVADETATFEVPLRAPSGRGVVRVDAAALGRGDGTLFRMLSWNVSDRGPLESPEAFVRTIAALDPDVVLFDEVSPDIEASWFADRLAGLTGEWTLLRGRAGGRQTALIASRLPLASVPPLERVAYPDSIYDLVGQSSTPQLQSDLETGSEDAMPVLGGMVEAGGRTILLLIVDLQCCGYAGSTEDRARAIMAAGIRSAVATVIGERRPDAVIIAGDFNLVGSRDPLDVLMRGLDPAGGDLVAAATRRLDGVSMATWSARSPFPPGRLDWVLYSPGLLDVQKAFPFHPADLTERAAIGIGLDAAVNPVSDHTPVIVDFATRR